MLLRILAIIVIFPIGLLVGGLAIGGLFTWSLPSLNKWKDAA